MRSPPPERVLRFDAFILDLSRCVLLRGVVEVPLRRQAFDMLRYLAEHPGRVIPKDELVTAVWRRAGVSDDSLGKCIRDIREALGDQDQQIIKTAWGRGYLFASEVLRAESGVGGDAGAGTPITQAPAPAQSPITGTPAESPQPNPPMRLHVRSFLNAAQQRIRWAGWHGPALLAGGLLIVMAAAAAWSLSRPAPVASSARHYAILGRAVLANERSPKANREALAFFAKALDLNADFVPALLGYAKVTIVDVREGWAPRDERQARLDEAEAAIKRALTLRPKHPVAHHLHGFLLRARGDSDQALAAFQRAFALNPRSAWTRAEIGRSKIDLGRAEEALTDIEAAIRMRPGERDIHVWYYWAGLAAAHAGKHQAVIHWMRKTRDAHGAHYGISALLLAAAHAKLGREDEGRALLAEYLAARPRLSLSELNHDFPAHNAALAAARARLTDVLRRLGLRDEPLDVGAIH